MLFMQGENLTLSPEDTTTCCNLLQIVENFRVARPALNQFVNLSSCPIECKIGNREKPNMFSVFQPLASQWGWSGSTHRVSASSPRGGCRCTPSHRAPASSSTTPLWRTPASTAARPLTPAATPRRRRLCWRSTVSLPLPYPRITGGQDGS